jgi:hypothetical protein
LPVFSGTAGTFFDSRHLHRILGSVSDPARRQKDRSRYYGFYANRSKLSRKQHALLFARHDIARMKKRLFWRLNIYHAYRFDPLLCHCGHQMVLIRNLPFFPNAKYGGG